MLPRISGLPSANPLKNAHAALDTTVLTAYGLRDMIQFYFKEFDFEFFLFEMIAKRVDEIAKDDPTKKFNDAERNDYLKALSGITAVQNSVSWTGEAPVLLVNLGNISHFPESVGHPAVRMLSNLSSSWSGASGGVSNGRSNHSHRFR